MGAFPLDRLKMARKLEASGMDRAMARGVVEVVVETMTGSRVDRVVVRADNAATIRDLVRNGGDDGSRGGCVNTGSRVDRVVVRADNAATIRDLVRNGGNDGSRGGCVNVASRDWLARVRRDFTIQLGGMFVMWVCITIIGFSYLLPHR